MKIRDHSIQVSSTSVVPVDILAARSSDMGNCTFQGRPTRKFYFSVKTPFSRYKVLFLCDLKAYF